MKIDSEQRSVHIKIKYKYYSQTHCRYWVYYRLDNCSSDIERDKKNLVIIIIYTAFEHKIQDLFYLEHELNKASLENWKGNYHK